MPWVMVESYILGTIHTLTELVKPSETTGPGIQGPSPAFCSGIACLEEFSPQPFSAWPQSQLPVRRPYLRQLGFLLLQSQLKVRRRHTAVKPRTSPRLLGSQTSFIKMNFVPRGFDHGGVIVYLITVPMATGSQWEGTGIHQHLPVK